MVSDLSLTSSTPSILNEIPLAELFPQSHLPLARKYCSSGAVRVVTANLRPDFAGLFGTIRTDPTSNQIPNSAEISVVVERRHNGITIDGRSSRESSPNGPDVLALLLTARGDHSSPTTQTTPAPDPHHFYTELSPVAPVPKNHLHSQDSEDDQGIDWFEFTCGVEIDGKRVNLIPAIVDFLASQPDSFHPDVLAKQKFDTKIPLTCNGDIIPFPADRLHFILCALTELHDPAALSFTGTLTLHPMRAAQVAELKEPDSTRRFVPDSPHQLLAKAQVLRDLEMPINKKASTLVDPSFQGSLRPYQALGFHWLQSLRAQKLGGILADDMGLGKTVQTLAHLLAEKNSGRTANLPSLILAPKSVLHNWAGEAQKFAPSLRVLVLSGPQRKKYFSVLNSADLVITSYPLLTRDAEILASQPFHFVILDEAHLIKNSRSQLFQAACQLDARHRLCLSGTPIENHLGELWSLFHFLMPGFLGSESAYHDSCRVPIEKHRDEAARQRLADRIAPFILRRTKQSVATDLPPKTEIIQEIGLHSRQTELYEAVRASLDKRVQEEIAERGFKRSKILVLDALLKLRQVCCHPALVKLEALRHITQPKSNPESAKLDRLIEMLHELVPAGRRILVFSQFTQMLELIAAELDKSNIPYTTLTGQTRNRKAVCDTFQSGRIPVFLISLRAGGTGLNLTTADTVIHFDPWWNPALESQATDRAYRIGQKNPVFVYKLITRQTIEEKIFYLQQKKRALYDGILANDASAAANLDFTEEDLNLLLAPSKRTPSPTAR
ncbi:MAG: DEAD/DEAH box helicase [Verrucomicrobiota bacterium]